MVLLAVLAVMLLLLPFAIRASTKKRDTRHGVRWRGIQWDSQERVDAIVASAIALQRAGDVPGAIAGYDRALALKRTGTVLNNRGCALLEAGEVDRALADLREAVTLDPASATAHCSLAEALSRAGDQPAALASLERAAALDASWRGYARTAPAFAALRATDEGARWIKGE